MKTLASNQRQIDIGNGRTVTRQVRELSGDLNLPPRELIRGARLNRARSRFLSGSTLTQASLAESVGQFYDSIIAGAEDKEVQAQRVKLLQAANSNDRTVRETAKRQLASLRVEVFSNYLYAPALWLAQYAEVINLKADERPVAQRITKQEVAVYGVGGDGSPKQVKVALDPDETLVPLGYLTTDLVRYRKVDVYRGRVTDPALATINLAYDFGMKVDGKVQDLLIGDGASFFGPFTFAGKRANWSYVAHSRINTANLPSTNDVVVYAQDGTTKVDKFGFQVLAAVVDYAARWNGAFQDGVDLKPTGRIILPPGHIKEIMDGIYPSGATRNKIADDLMEQGWFGVNFLGTDWLFVPDSTLDPNDRVCYPEFNKKPIQVFFKPELDEEKDSAGDYQIESKNEEERYMRRVFGAYYDSSRRAFAARFDYSGA